jgi:hypothetical protein
MTLVAEAVAAVAGSFKIFLRGPSWNVKGQDEIIIFEASSQLSESRSSQYDGFNIVHLPTDIYAYRNTSGRKFSLAGKLVSRTHDEARVNAHKLNNIRQWIMPDFGNSGATPPICYLTAYKNLNIKNLSVIVRSYSWAFPEDIDYIFSGGDFESMPVIGQLTMELDEIYSPKEITDKVWKIDNSVLPFDLRLPSSGESSYQLGGGGIALFSPSSTPSDITSTPEKIASSGRTKFTSDQINNANANVEAARAHNTSNTLTQIVPQLQKLNSFGSVPGTGFGFNNFFPKTLPTFVKPGGG